MALVATNLKNLIEVTITTQQRYSKAQSVYLLANKTFEEAKKTLLISSLEREQSIENVKQQLFRNI